MGEVFLAEDTDLGRLVALKVLLSEVSHSKERIRRFIQEAKAVSALNHPNILTIHETGFLDGTRFIVSEFVKGVTLRDKLKDGPLNLFETLEIAVQISSALYAAHSSQIIHRDIKPDNIMIREDNLVKVLDFGLAKLSVAEPESINSESPTRDQINTIPGVIIGTVGYMSPEQARGKTVDHRTDIFSFGIVLYEILTGIQPFYGETRSDVIAAILTKEPQNPCLLNAEIPFELERIISRMLCKDPAERYQNVGHLLEDFKEIKRNLEFNSTNEFKAQAKARLEAKTEILKADTGNTVNVTTQSIAGFSSNKIPLPKLTNKVKSISKSKFSLLLALGLFTVAAISAYLLLPKLAANQPKPEAVNLYNLGTEALRDGTSYKASKMLEDAVSLDNNFTIAHAKLAEAWAELDYLGRARNEMLKVRELQQRQSFLSSFSKTEDSLYIDAISATVLNNFTQAAGIYETIAQKRPNDAFVYLDLGRAYEKNEQIDKAIEYYEKAIGLNAQYGAAYLRLGILRSRKAEYEKAASAFDQAENIYDRLSNDEGIAEVKIQRGTSLNHQDRLKPALEQFEQVIRHPRTSKYQQIKAMLQISSVLCSKGKTEQAQVYASDAIKLARDERMDNLATSGLIDLGYAFFVGTDYEQAEQHFRQAIEFARKDDGRRNEARALLSLSSLFVNSGKPDEALQYVNQAFPFYLQGGYQQEISQAYLLLGFASQMKSDYSTAVESFEKALQSGEIMQRAQALTGLGTVLSSQEQYPKALAYFEQTDKLYEAMQSNYNLGFSQYNTADILSKLGRLEEAKQIIAKVEKIFADDKTDHSELQAKYSLLKARLALSENNFPEAIKITEQITLLKDPEIAAETYRLMGLAKVLSRSKSGDGIQICVKSVETARQTDNLQTVKQAKLALAEAYLSSDKNKLVTEEILEIKNYFISAGQKETGWRALLVLAKAYQQKGDLLSAKESVKEALETLAELEKDWGAESFKSYSNRPDIKIYSEQAKELS